MPGELYTVPQTRSLVAGYGAATPWGLLLPPGGNVAAFVRSTGAQNADDSAIGPNLVQTLAAGLARCRPNSGDTVFVLPGHTENVTDATMLSALVAGTKIIGVGRGATMPTFRWTTAAAQWAMNKADVVLSGLRLRMEGFNGVTNPILVTGADNLLNNLDIETSSGAANKATTAIQLNAGADRFEFVSNRIRGLAAGAVTDVMLVNGSVDSFRYTDNEVISPAAVGNGVLRFAAACTNVTILRNILCNTFTGGTSGLTFANVALDGVCADNRVGVNNAAATAATVVVVGGASNLIKFYENYLHDGTTNTFGILGPGTATS